MAAIKNVLEQAEAKMLQSVTFLEEALVRIRAGKANVHILDGVKVESYGSLMPLTSVATVSTPDAKTITVLPWDKTMLQPIEKALMDSEVGITPENNGEIIRLGIPPLTEERRKMLVKQTRTDAENAKIGVRNVRRDANDTIKKAVKEGTPEDEGKETEAAIQKMHDKYLKKLDELIAAKEREIMTV
ncbi:ribosome recycling factor [Candidatus Symbiothrix dinenymphae]|uniref:ribosome recycling factor n=1 Tax=Candidatus Symbiothrix dinenymphae TaxID=467085 RepID=UPI0006C1F31B|nr:ribosome recycling factor [Candidatus Symbiothrix dinenymphae]GAP71492.1 ribosome recycling factor [Candidatus Symbiothrix dinenymphae]